MDFRRIIAIIAGKLVILLSRVAGNQGTAFPGRLARRVYPSILTSLAANIDQKIIIITGTNGKTSTSNMIAAILRENGSTFIHNHAGANMLTGITTAFIRAASIGGARHYEYAILETDEAHVAPLMREIKADVLLITNFFRDQLDRFGELEYTAELVKDAINKNKVDLLLNSDDPLLSDLQRPSVNSWYYGFADTLYDEKGDPANREGRSCPLCGHEIAYESYHYDQLGKYRCLNCNNHNPHRNFTGHDLRLNPYISFYINRLSIASRLQGFYNAYNILAAVSLAQYLTIDEEIIQKAILLYRPPEGRMEKFLIQGKTCYLTLVKNPTGLNQSLNILKQDSSGKCLFMALNDNAGDGRDISWIWDGDVEEIVLRESAVKSVVCSGLRSGDMALRFKYAGFDVNQIQIEPRLKNALHMAIAAESETIYAFCTYSALFACRKILGQMQMKAGGTGQAEGTPIEDLRKIRRLS